MMLARIIKKVVREFGIDVRRVRPFSDEYDTLVHIISKMGLRTIIDVGANDGGFGINMFRAGYTHRILSFEPLVEAHSKLRQRAARYSNWIVMPRCAIGDHEGVAEFHVAGNSSSSSLMVMAELHTAVAPTSAPIRTITVPVKRLDDIIEAFDPKSEERLFLKIDTQGSESAVLDGAAGLLDRVAVIRAEMSFAELYKGQELFGPMYNKIKALGFDLWEIVPVLRDESSGRVLQCDATFVRSDAAFRGD